MAIAERLVARVSFSQKLTGPERGPSWARASGVAGGGWKGVLRGAAAPSSTRLPLSGRLTTEKVRLTSGKQVESFQNTPLPRSQEADALERADALNPL